MHLDKGRRGHTALPRRCTMFKTYPTSSFFLLPQRLKLASLARQQTPSPTATSTPTTPTTQTTTTQTSSLSTDASLSAKQDPRQPILLASHAAAHHTQAMASQPQSDSAPRQQRIVGAYFPLGYKEAVQQWVS